MNKPQLAALPDARFQRRVLAGLYDLLLLFAVGFLYTLVLTLVAVALGKEPLGLSVQNAGENMTLTAADDYQPMFQGVLYQAGLYMALVMFYLGFWRTRSATLGMQTWRMQLIDENGGKPTWKQLWLRALFGTLSLMFFGLGFFYSLIDRQNRTLHDLLSRTRVVVYPKGGIAHQ